MRPGSDPWPGTTPTPIAIIIQSIVAGFGASNLDGVTINIFKASEANGSPEAGKINTWTLWPSGDPTTCDPIDWDITENWPSITRQVDVGPSTELDVLGVDDRDHP